jgi:uncharacterized protein YgiM (DUF1202 family)
MRRVPLRGVVVAALLAFAIAGSTRAQEAQAPEPAPAPAPAETERPAAAPSPAPSPAPRPRAAAKPPEEPPKPTEDAWVSGELKLNFRATASSTGIPLGVVTTGDRVGVIERKGGWARVLVGESQVGWLPESALASQPPPLEHVAQLEAQVAELQSKLAEVEQEAASLRAQMAEVAGRDAEREEAMRRLTDENRDLRAGERWPYLVTGAGILGIGITVGRFLLGGSSRRSYSRIRY